MTTMRDRLVALGAVAVLVLLTGFVILRVRDAEQAGIASREDAAVKIVDQQADSMNARILQAYGSIGALYGAPGKFSMVEGDPADARALAPFDSNAEVGTLLIDRTGQIVNGAGLRDPSVIGTKLERPGVEKALAGEPAVIAVGPGYTTTQLTGMLTTPVRDASGAVVGVHLYEFAVSPDSAFNQEVKELRDGQTGTYSFVDSEGTVIASNEVTTIGKRLPGAERLEPGRTRRDGTFYVVADVPAADWRVVFSKSIDELEGDLTGPLRTAQLVVVAIVALAAAVGIITLQRRLRAAREEQRRLAEMAVAREEFTSIVSHELRTPVAGLLGFLQTTIDHWDEMPDDDRLRAVDRAFQNARRLQHLTADVLDTAGIEAGTVDYQVEVLDLGQLVSDVVQTARDANPGRRFDVDAPAPTPSVRGDGIRLRQIVTNLLDNAVNSSPTDSVVEVRITETSGRARVTVRDYGSGIDRDERERIFEKYTRGRAGVSKGSGLGLFIARQIASAHGGTLQVDDVEGAGASVSLEIPAAGQVTDAR